MSSGEENDLRPNALPLSCAALSIETSIEREPRVKIPAILLDAQRRQLQRPVGPQPRLSATTGRHYWPCPAHLPDTTGSRKPEAALFN